MIDTTHTGFVPHHEPSSTPARSARIRSVFLLLLGLLCAGPVSAVEPYRTESVILLQPDFVLKERVSSVDSLSAYIKAVQSAAGAVLAEEPPSPASVFLVLAVRPGGRSMVWLDAKPGLAVRTAGKLRAAILAVPPFEARGGVVVFALNANLWGAGPAQGFPDPQEWRQAMEGRDEPVEIGELVDMLWPDLAGT